MTPSQTLISQAAEENGWHRCGDATTNEHLWQFERGNERVRVQFNRSGVFRTAANRTRTLSTARDVVEHLSLPAQT